MQYLLTSSEFENLVPLKDKKLQDAALKKFREGIMGDMCVHHKKPRTEWCCNCPFSSIGKNPHKLTYEESKALCPETRYYGQ